MSDQIPETEITQTGEELQPVGTFRGPDVGEVHVDLDPAKWTLTALRTEHTLFSAALLTATGVPFDPIALYWEENSLPMCDTPFEFTHEQILLAGLPDPYNRIIYACPNTYASGLIAFLDRFSVRIGTAVHDSVKQIVPVVDWRLLAKSSVAPKEPPRVPVILYGIESPTEIYAWQPPKDLWRESVRLVKWQKNTKPKDKSTWASRYRKA